MGKQRRSQGHEEAQTKAERRQGRAARPAKAGRKQARAAGRTKAERKQAKAGKRAARAGIAVSPDGPGDDAPAEERIEWRLARIEEAVAAQSERSQELLERVDAMLREGPEPAAEAKAGAGSDGGGE